MKSTVVPEQLIEKALSVEIESKPDTSLGVRRFSQDDLSALEDRQPTVTQRYSPVTKDEPITYYPPTETQKGLIILGTVDDEVVSYMSADGSNPRRSFFLKELGYDVAASADEQVTLIEVPSIQEDFDTAFKYVNGDMKQPLQFGRDVGRNSCSGYISSIGKDRLHPNGLSSALTCHDLADHGVVMLFFPEISELAVGYARSMHDAAQRFGNPIVGDDVGKIDGILSTYNAKLRNNEDDAYMISSADYLLSGALGAADPQMLHIGAARLAAWYQKTTGRELPIIGEEKMMAAHTRDIEKRKDGYFHSQRVLPRSISQKYRFTSDTQGGEEITDRLKASLNRTIRQTGFLPKDTEG